MDDLNDQAHTHVRFAVIPTPEKLKADERFKGRGVRIAFLDSGFYPHADIRERIVTFHDVMGKQTRIDPKAEPKGTEWHGTQTSVSCAGNGGLCDHIYRGIASEAELVLVKASNDEGAIPDENIELGLRWILDNHKKYNIRILNMSLGGDVDLPASQSKIDQLAEECVKEGIVVIVAAGNSESIPIPPANSPSVITVGGYSDENQLDTTNFELYHSAFGVTADGIVKPEIIAPAMYVAAPILPNTPDYLAAQTLAHLLSQPDYKLKEAVFENWEEAGLEEEILQLDTDEMRSMVETEIENRKIIATHYQYVDGTSFAAPITASVVAQMIEANPKLTPIVIKNILISTASLLSEFPAIRQGFGVLNAPLAVKAALEEIHDQAYRHLMPPRVQGRKIVFCYHDDSAQSVYLAGEFNNWKSDEIPFTEGTGGLWQAHIPIPLHGKYAYKFVINGETWKEDPSNLMKTDDGMGGFNSVLIIK